jgi:hypothetical protein
MIAVDKQVTDAMRSVVGALLGSDSKRVTKYLTPNLVIHATRLHPRDRREATEHFVVKVGKPNHAQREFIKTVDSFPVHRIQHKAFPAAD